MTGKFKIGERVKAKFFSGSSSGTIVGVFQTYYVVEFTDKHSQPYTYSYQEHELVTCEDVFTFHTCECGAKMTSFPDSHALWCPLFKKGF